MNEQKTTTLDEAIMAARQLPAETQEALAQEIMERVADFSVPRRPVDRQDLIRERLAKPLRSIARDDLMAMLRKYDSSM